MVTSLPRRSGASSHADYFEKVLSVAYLCGGGILDIDLGQGRVRVGCLISGTRMGGCGTSLVLAIWEGEMVVFSIALVVPSLRQHESSLEL